MGQKASIMDEVITAKQGRGMLFSGSLPEAIYVDRKKVTRRLVKPQPRKLKGILEVLEEPWPDASSPITFCDLLEEVREGRGQEFCPYGRVGDQFYVKEAWRVTGWSEDFKEVMIQYRASSSLLTLPKKLPQDDAATKWYDWLAGYCEKLLQNPKVSVSPQGAIHWEDDSVHPWRSSLFMPRWASRSIREIDRLGLENVQDITEEEAILEGVWTSAPDYTVSAIKRNHIAAFRNLWDNLHYGYNGWNDNPWVWVVGFHKVD